MYKEIIFDINTKKETMRDYTPEEIAEVETAQTKAAAKIAEQAEKDAARKAIFDKLGISEEEAKLLLS